MTSLDGPKYHGSNFQASRLMSRRACLMVIRLSTLVTVACPGYAIHGTSASSLTACPTDNALCSTSGLRCIYLPKTVFIDFHESKTPA